MFSRLTFTLHGILGLITGLLLLVISLSGCVLVFSHELDQAINPQLLTVHTPARAPQPALSLDRLYRQARTDFPHIPYVRFRRLPESPEHTVEISLERSEEWKLAYYDPYTGKLLGQRDARKHFLGWMLGLHYSLLAGRTGELLVGILSIALLLSVLTGAFIYRKHLWKVLLFRSTFRFSNWRTAASSWHRLVGVWSLLLNLVLAVTGFWMMRYVFLPSTYAEQQPEQSANLAFPVSLDSLSTASGRLMIGFEARGIRLPQKAGDKIIFYGQLKNQSPLFHEYSSSIEFDPVTGALASALPISGQSAAEQWDARVYPLHAGKFGGFLIKIVYALLGMAPAVLSITGFLLWWRRKRRAF